MRGTTAVNDFSSSVVVVTGAARGLGRATACHFAHAGAQVFLCDKDELGVTKLAEEVSSFGGKAVPFTIDLASAGSPEHMIASVWERAHRLDVLVNNARSGTRTSGDSETETSWDETMAVTLKAAYFSSRAAIRRISGTNGGAIVNVSSVADRLVTGESPSYHAAKAALTQLTRYLAVLGGQNGVRVNAVAPGFIVKGEHRVRFDSPANRRYREAAEFAHPLGRVGAEDDVADAVLFLASERASFITGQCLTVDGGLTLREHSSLLRSYAGVE